MSVRSNDFEAPTVSVVIPTYERRARMEEAVSEFLAQPGLHEIVAVVDGSTDGTVEALELLASNEPRLTLVARENLGIVRSRIDGVRAASGEVVMMMDDDIRPGPGLVAGHAAHHRDGRRLVALGYMPVAPEMRERGSFPCELYATEYERAASRWETEPESILATFWAGNSSLRREDFLALAPAIEAIPDIYHEDRDFGLCCEEAGMEAIFDPSLAASHLYERDYAGFLRDARRAAEGTVAMHKRHPEAYARTKPEDITGALSRPEKATALAVSHSQLLRRGLLAAAALAWRTGQHRASRRLGHLCWCSEQIRVLRASVVEA